jgi:ABC-2 type transport system permease protein
MLHLLKIEWLKIKNYKAFWFFSIFYLVSIFLINYIGWSLNQRLVENMPIADAILKQPYAFPKVWKTVGWMSSWLLYFPGMLFIMLMVNEFNFKTHRQNVIDGLSRDQFVSVKLVLAALFAVVITLINGITAAIFGSLTPGTFGVEGMQFLGYVFLQSVAYIFFALMLSVLFRRSGIAIIVFIIYGLIVEWLITAVTTFEMKIAPAGYFLPLQVSDVLLPIPFGDETIYPDLPHVGVLIGAILAYIAAYVYFARRKFVHDDL